MHINFDYYSIMRYLTMLKINTSFTIQEYKNVQIHEQTDEKSKHNNFNISQCNTHRRIRMCVSTK